MKSRGPVLLHFGERHAHNPWPRRADQAAIPRAFISLSCGHGFNCTTGQLRAEREARLERSLNFCIEHWLIRMKLKDSSLLRSSASSMALGRRGRRRHDRRGESRDRRNARHDPQHGRGRNTACDRRGRPALPAWAAKTAKDRAAVLRRWFDLMLAHQEDLATLMTAEQGKPLAESKGEIAYAASFIEWFAEEGKRALWRHRFPAINGQAHLVLRQPVGVVAAITPWNFPVGDDHAQGGTGARRRLHHGLASRPTQTPFSALALAELGERAGIPEGVFNVITGSAAAIGGEMTANPAVRKLTFTGSTEIGKKSDGAMRGHHQEAVARARRQCAVHRVRRCRSRCGGPGRDREQIPQYRPDLRLREPVAGAGRACTTNSRGSCGGGRKLRVGDGLEGAPIKGR